MTGPPSSGMDGHLGDRLSGLLDGELGGAQADEARRHLAVCPSCARELQAVGQARSWLRHLPPVDPPAGFGERLLAADPTLAEPPRRRPAVVPLRGRRAAVATVAGLAAAAAAVLGLFPAPDPPAEPQVTRLVEAHATAGQGTDPLSRLVPVGVPVSFGR